ncbi:aminopeptidase [Desulfonatronospira sp.]|uniref:aminopeptidase n=1 Tax=Desulfonatronospira sp. TaxID=1962951 RepID=UPI0025B87E08|nr:aminopeptidase [Desulfonatronospira sp.]
MEFKTRNCWEVYKSKKHRGAMDKLAHRYVDFLSRCKTERETVEWVRSRAVENGFSEDWSSSRVFKVHKGKSIFLAWRGNQPLSQGVRLLGAHADTPRLDLKQRPVYEECQVSLAKTHYYGGIRKHQWLARPLALHGVIIKTDGTRIDVNMGEKESDPVFTVSDLLPHLAQKQIEKKLSQAFEAEKLNVVLGHVPYAQGKKNSGEDTEKKSVKKNVLHLLNQKFGIVEEDLYSAELQAVPAGSARFVGLDQGLIGGYGHDDRVCVFTGMEAFLQQGEPEYTRVAIFWDKEEIGSEGSSSARSLFMQYCLEELLENWEPGTPSRTMFAAPRAVSADVHAAMDPDYQDVHEKLNASLIGHGPVFCKFTGHRGKVGANDAHAEYIGWLRRILNSAGIPWQMAETGKVDLGGGGTVAKFLAVYGMDIIDFGPGVLGMHSPFEIVSKADVYASYLAYSEFFKAGDH